MIYTDVLYVLIRTYTHTYARTYMHVRMYVCMHGCVNVCMDIRITYVRITYISNALSMVTYV